MENKTMSTSFQSEAKDFNEEMKLTQNTAYQPVVKTHTSTEEAITQIFMTTQVYTIHVNFIFQF
uniref:Uncharacterized protein n=1 Tax=Amphimedon queenslandica TaxID=400682 RepID=A0A1X7SRP4_AMPQE